jgi:hypothetical protein
MVGDWRHMTLDHVPSRPDIEDHIILCLAGGIGNSDRMRTEWLRFSKLVRTGDEGDIRTPIGKYTNEHAWVLGDLNMRKIIKKLSEKEYKPYFVANSQPTKPKASIESDEQTEPTTPTSDVPLPKPGDANDKRSLSRTSREGQDAFRSDIIEAYMKCAITGSEEQAALQAAHIIPYIDARSNVLINGLCLRADIHCLFDKGLMEIDLDFRVVVSSAVSDAYYIGLAGTEIHRPPLRSCWPSKKLLEKRLLFNKNGTWE